MKNINAKQEGSILILDDDSQFRTLLPMVVKDQYPSTKISLAKNKKEAIKLLENQPHDLLLLDIHLGPGDSSGGLDVVKYAKKKKYIFRAIALTSFDNFAFQSGKAGFDEFLRKPVENRKLVDVISKQFESLRLELDKRKIGTAFCIMPLDDKFFDIYLYGIKAASQAVGFECFRIDEKIFTKDILSQIHKAIDDSNIIIADLTGNNPNVFYEVGYAHAKKNR